jgi:indole-3-acetate monooxygenase
VTSLTDQARALGDVIRAQADASERQRRLTDEIVGALKQSQLLRALVPRVYGGPEATPLEMMDAITETSRHDGATGWCVMIAATTSLTAHHLEPEWAQHIHGSPTSCSGGAAAPSGHAVVTAAGVEVSGHWTWGSGTDHCDWICGGTLSESGAYQLAWFPTEQVEIIDNWDPIGLRATASNDYRVNGVTIQPGAYGGLPNGRSLDTALARAPVFTVLSAGVAAALVGIALGAVESFMELAETRIPVQSAKTTAQSSHTHREVARAATAVAAAQALLHDRVATMWDIVMYGDPVDVATRGGVRLAAAHVAESTRLVTATLQDMAGGDGIGLGRLARAFRDVHTASAHITVAPRNFESVGRSLAGHEVDSTFW